MGQTASSAARTEGEEHDEQFGHPAALSDMLQRTLYAGEIC
jgi:hypothetical protein